MKIICTLSSAQLKASDSKAFSKYLKYSSNTQDISTMESALLITFTSLSFLSLYLYINYNKKKQLGGLGRAVLWKTLNQTRCTNRMALILLLR